MSSNEVVIGVYEVSKCYEIYNKPQDRLKQFFLPTLRRFFGIVFNNYFKNFWALRCVTFEINRGETVGIIGKNGAGKSTLLQMICGTLSPSDGSIQVNGKVAALLELGSGFNLDFTGRENVYMNAALYGLSRKEIDLRFESIASFADIGDFIEQPVKTYSSGMMVRLAFAVIAHVDADILIIDEALAVGDVFFTQKCMRFLRSFMEGGTVLFVSHDINSVKNLCNRAIWIEDGHIRLYEDSKIVCEHYLQAFYEHQQGISAKVSYGHNKVTSSSVMYRDQRIEFINSTNLRNDLKILDFKIDERSFGKGSAKIIRVQMLNGSREPLAWIVGGEQVILKIEAQCFDSLDSIIIGFFIRDRLGQDLFGDNTWMSYQKDPVGSTPGSIIEANFTFNMPILPVGDYCISVSIGNGTQESCEQQHWIHEALSFKSLSSSVATGLIGVPMSDISLKVHS
jgi:lipopolysaccharide transport system ATP-binding protein